MWCVLKAALTHYSPGGTEAPSPTSLTGYLAQDPPTEQTTTVQLTGYYPWDSRSALTFPIPLGDKAWKVKLRTQAQGPVHHWVQYGHNGTG